MKKKLHIGVLLIATGKYDVFVEPLLQSARPLFFPNQKVTYFLFSDTQRQHWGEDVVLIPHEHRGFPLATLLRFETFAKHKTILKACEYLFYCDVDMLIWGEVNHAILPHTNTDNGLVAVQHPGYTRKRGQYETNPHSKAYVAKHEGTQYFAGGFNGGTSEAFLTMAEVLSININTDLEKGIIARWHDESHLNRYLINHPPKVLSPSYCYPESWKLPYPKIIIALDKNHQAIREMKWYSLKGWVLKIKTKLIPLLKSHGY